MTATTDRPASFDNRIMAYRPGLLRLAYKLGYRGEGRHDLVTDTIIHCLDRWRNFREDGGMWNWLYWTMRGIVTNRRNRNRLSMVDDADGRLLKSQAMDPPQQMQAELSETLRRISGRDGDVLMRRVMGDGLCEIGQDMGISHESVRQLEIQARERLRAGVVYRA